MLGLKLEALEINNSSTILAQLHVLFVSSSKLKVWCRWLPPKLNFWKLISNASVSKHANSGTIRYALDNPYSPVAYGRNVQVGHIYLVEA